LENNHLVFFFNFTENGAYMPNNFLTKFELDRITLDVSGALSGQTDYKRKMLLGMFIIGKIFLP
jgi:hypothetical protein